jgi:alkenylglycerophosphocholine/alkenylglycerophosphoethanolamine hydrolase
MDMADKILWRTGQLAALLFLVLLVPLHPYPLSCVLKAIPVTALAVLVFRNLPTRPGRLLGVGLLFSVVGDVALDIDRTRYFILGLGAFLSAHVLYIAAFVHWRGWSRSRLLPVAAVAVYAAVLAFLLRDIPADKWVPVMLYLGTISAMVMAAIGIRPVSPLIVTGASVFMMSDTIIAVNKFMHPLPHSTLFNIGLYFLAQFLIVKGVLGQRGRRVT